MKDVQLDLEDNGKGTFYIMSETGQAGRMDVEVKGDMLTVYHTEVDEKEEGKGFAKTLLNAMADYARKHNLKVKPLCSYVNFHFHRHAEDYADLWKKQ